MKFTATAAFLAAAAGVNAWASNYTVVTEVVQSYTTYCPYATTMTYGSHTYTVTEPTTLTITDCPCTITHPVYTTSAVYTTSPCPPGQNTTMSTPVGTAPGGSYTPPPSSATPPPVPGAAGKVALSGAGLAGIVGIAAFVL